MPVIPLMAMVRKDLQIFFSDRRSVIVSFVVPIAIASFFGAVFASGGQNRQPARIAIAIIDHDGSAISKAILAGAETDNPPPTPARLDLSSSTTVLERAQKQLRELDLLTTDRRP